MRFIFASIILFSMAACNSVYVKPDSIDATQTFYADRGGYSMKRADIMLLSVPPPQIEMRSQIQKT